MKARWEKLEHAQALLSEVQRKQTLYAHQAERLQAIVDDLAEQETRYRLSCELERWQGEKPEIRYAGKTLEHRRGEFDYWLTLGNKQAWVSVDRDGCLFVFDQQVTIENLQHRITP